MTPFFRIKHYLINLDRLAYVRVEENFIDFGFSFPVEKTSGHHFIRLERGSELDPGEFEQVEEFVLQLPDPDRVVVI
jgi:hypothetical protein